MPGALGAYVDGLFAIFWLNPLVQTVHQHGDIE